MALCSKTDADDATPLKISPSPLDGSVRLQLQCNARGRWGRKGLLAWDLLDPAVRFPSDGLTEGFFPPYSVKLVFTCKQHESCKRKPVQRARQETEKLEFCVAEGSWSSSRQIFLLRTRSKGKWRPIQKPLKLMARTSCLLHSILTTNQKKIWRQLKWLRPRIDAKLLPKIK